MTLPLLQLKNLTIDFSTRSGVIRAVDGVSLHIDAGETLGIVGESGSGKSVTALSVMRLIPQPPGNIVAGDIHYGEVDVLGLNEAEMRKIRGKEIAMIFQDPLSALNPVHTIGHQIIEALQIHSEMNKNDALKRAIELLEIVGIPRPSERAQSYPHEFSGGMRQRVMIALAIANRPKVILADEPTTALDVTVQAQILDLVI